jgi:hypothetical protein
MAGNGKCCNHDHVGDDEQWMTVEEIADTVFDAVEAGITALIALPSDSSRDERRAAMRSEFDRRRAASAPDSGAATRATTTTRADLRDQRARRRWGVA